MSRRRKPAGGSPGKGVPPLSPAGASSLPDAVAEHRADAPRGAGLAVITVSDTRTVETDVSGARLRALAEQAGCTVPFYCIVPDEPAQIAAVLDLALEVEQVECVVLTGGTGVSRRDGTPDVVAPKLDVRIDGFGELFRMLSYQQIGSAAMLSRAVAGLIAGKPVFSLPGSVAAVELAMTRLILPELGHLLREIRRFSAALSRPSPPRRGE